MRSRPGAGSVWPSLVMLKLSRPPPPVSLSSPPPPISTSRPPLPIRWSLPPAPSSSSSPLVPTIRSDFALPVRSTASATVPSVRQLRSAIQARSPCLPMPRRSLLLGLDLECQSVHAGHANRRAGHRPISAPRFPDLPSDANPAGPDHLRALPQHPLGPGRDPVAAQEPDPQVDLADLDHQGATQEHEPERAVEQEQARDRQRQEHARMMTERKVLTFRFFRAFSSHSGFNGEPRHRRRRNGGDPPTEGSVRRRDEAHLQRPPGGRPAWPRHGQGGDRRRAGARLFRAG